MVWDGLCFCFLLLQKRLFKSYYFFHIVDETKAMSILASRGAELLEDIHQKRIQIQENVEKNVLQKLKFKMDKIKASQRKIQGPSYREPQTHKVGKIRFDGSVLNLYLGCGKIVELISESLPNPLYLDFQLNRSPSPRVPE